MVKNRSSKDLLNLLHYGIGCTKKNEKELVSRLDKLLPENMASEIVYIHNELTFRVVLDSSANSLYVNKEFDVMYSTGLSMEDTHTIVSAVHILQYG